MEHLLCASRGLATFQLGVGVGFAHGVVLASLASALGVCGARAGQKWIKVRAWRLFSILRACGMGGERPEGRSADHTSRCMAWCRRCSSRFRVSTAPGLCGSAPSPSVALDCPPLSLAMPLGCSDGYPFLHASHRRHGCRAACHRRPFPSVLLRRAMETSLFVLQSGPAGFVFSVCNTATSISGARLSSGCHGNVADAMLPRPHAWCSDPGLQRRFSDQPDCLMQASECPTCRCQGLSLRSLATGGVGQ